MCLSHTFSSFRSGWKGYILFGGLYSSYVYKIHSKILSNCNFKYFFSKNVKSQLNVRDLRNKQKRSSGEFLWFTSHLKMIYYDCNPYSCFQTSFYVKQDLRVASKDNKYRIEYLIKTTYEFCFYYQNMTNSMELMIKKIH